MTFKIVTADERIKEKRNIKGVIFGPHGIGKTSLLNTLPDPSRVLFLNLEAGDLSVQDWPGISINIDTWEQARDMACLVGGPDPAATPINGQPQVYGREHYSFVAGQNPELVELLNTHDIHFWDSISVASRLCFRWSEGQPDSFSERTGKKDIRGTYGLVGREIVRWFTHIQHTPGKSVWIVGGLDAKLDEYNRPTWVPQIEGAQGALKLPGIFDEVISMVELRHDESGQTYRAFVCHLVNPWGYPAKDRSGRLALVEKPHLGELMTKISGPVQPVHERFNYDMPTKGGEQ